METDPTKLNPPIVWDEDACYGVAHFYVDAVFIDDEDLEKFSGYTIVPYGSSGSYYVTFPESSGREDDGLYDTLEEAHAALVKAAIEDGALPADIVGRKEGDAPQNE
jgi:hypothetical protein